MEVETQNRLKKISRRDTRWSMNSQRLEEIVAELMKPVNDIRRNFDTDLSALLEEYLTEAGLHALEQSETDDDSPVEINFTEIALLLQQSANIYSRKVDFLYQHVLRVSDSLNNSILEETANEEQNHADQQQAPSTNRRRVRAGPEDFELIDLEPSASARRDGASARPPPALPRMYIELEPRQLTDADIQLYDEAGEPIGVLADFHVSWRLQGGFLVEELEDRTYDGGTSSLPGLRALSPAFPPPPLGAAPGPAPTSPPTSPFLAPSTPPPSPFLALSPLHCSTPLIALRKERKRKIDVTFDLNGAAKLLACEEVVAKLRRDACDGREFSVPRRWRARVLARRRRAVLDARARALLLRPAHELRGFDITDGSDVGGFPGWGGEEAQRGLDCTAAELRRVRLRADDSDDDGFFEQSSYSDNDQAHSPLHGPAPPPPPPQSPHPSLSDALNDNPEWYAWRERVLARTSEDTPDVQAAAARVLRRLRAPSPGAPAAPAAPAPAPALHVDELLRAEHEAHGTHPAHLTLAALFLANSGNIEIIQGEPLTVNSFHVRLISDDEALLRPALSAELS